MAKSKKTIAQYLTIYKEHASKIAESITRIESEKKSWSREHDDLVMEWYGTDKVQALFSANPLDTWWKQITQYDMFHPSTLDSTLKKVFQSGCNDIKNIEDTQANNEARLARLNVKLEETRTQIGPLQKKWQAFIGLTEVHKTKMERIQAERALNHDEFIDARHEQWQEQIPQGSRHPLQQDYSRPQAWWAQPWILKMVNPTLLQNIEDAKKYKKLTGQNLYASAHAYWARKEKLHKAAEEYNSTHTVTEETLKTIKRLDETSSQLYEQKCEVEKALFKATGPDSLTKQIQVVQTRTVKDMLRHCLRERITSLAGVTLAVPTASEHSQLLGKEQAIDKVRSQLQTTLTKWTQARTNVDTAVSKLESLARKHSRSTQISMDASGVEKLSSSMDGASRNMQTRYQQGRNYLSNPTPFSRRDDDDYYQRQQTNNDSMFWTLAWMHLIMSDSHASGNHLNNETPLLDIETFQTKYDDTLGSLDTSALDVNTSMEAFNFDTPTFPSSDLVIDTPTFNVDTSFSVDTSSNYTPDYGSSSSTDYGGGGSYGD